jgi:hypothetical protein
MLPSRKSVSRNRSNAEHSGLTFFLATFVTGQLVLTRRMSSVLGYESRAIRTSGAQHLDCHEEYGPERTATILDLCLHAPAGIKIGDAHVAPQRQGAAGNRQAARAELTSVTHAPTSRSRAVKGGDPHIGRLAAWTVSPGLGRMAGERGDTDYEDPNRTQAHSVVDLET